MVIENGRERRRSRRAFIWIGAIVVILFAILTGAWYFLAGKLDAVSANLIAQAGTQGVAIDCRNRAVFGYPFRLGIRCDSVSVDNPDARFRFTSGGLRTAGQIYDPTRIVAELDAPVRVEAPGQAPISFQWGLAQASAHFWTYGVDRFALVLDQPTMSGPGANAAPLFRSDHVEVHARRRDAALDFAFSDTALTAALPQLAGLPPLDLAADVTVEGAADWLSGKLAGGSLGSALRGHTGTIRTLSIALPAANGAAASGAAVSGPFSVSPDGLVSGDFDVSVADPEGLAAVVARLAPQAAGIASTAAATIGFAGRAENGRSVVRVSVKDGRASIGMIPLGLIPPLR